MLGLDSERVRTDVGERDEEHGEGPKRVTDQKMAKKELVFGAGRES